MGVLVANRLLTSLVMSRPFCRFPSFKHCSREKGEGGLLLSCLNKACRDAALSKASREWSVLLTPQSRGVQCLAVVGEGMQAPAVPLWGGMLPLLPEHLLCSCPAPLDLCCRDITINKAVIKEALKLPVGRVC